MRNISVLPVPAAAAKLLIAAGTLIGATAMPPPASAGTECDWNKCDIVYNRSGRTIRIAQNSDSWIRCEKPRPDRYLPNGANSNSYMWPDHWRDTDCVNVNWHVWPGNNWRRVHGPLWIY